MQRETQYRPVTVGINLRTVAGSANERIVFRNGSVVVESKNLSEMLARVLRSLRFSTMRRCKEQRAILREHDSRAVSARKCAVRIGSENLPHLRQSFAVETTSRQDRRRPVSGAAVRPLGGFDIREIHEMVRREIRMKRNVH